MKNRHRRVLELLDAEGPRLHALLGLTFRLERRRVRVWTVVEGR